MIYDDEDNPLIMLEIWGDNREEQAKLFGRAVLPHFRGLSTA